MVASSLSPPPKKGIHETDTKNTSDMLNKFLNIFSSLALDMTEMINDQNKTKEDMKTLVDQFHQSISGATREITGVLMNQPRNTSKQAEPKNIYQEFLKAQEDEKSLILTGIDENKTITEIKNHIEPIIQTCNQQARVEKVTKLGKSKCIKITLASNEQRQILLQKLHLAKNTIQSNNIKIRKFLNQEELRKVKEMN
uniref:t-SNARE coiled-coil homology domain-containing protein n=1 Tax=Panagrolaimus sp. JU765 TaxID=591449 RepID=A0AC34QCU2_9BILA